MAILVAGGAGYIGSHTCVELLNAGYSVAVVDNLSNSCRVSIERVEKITGKKVQFYQADLRNMAEIDRVFREEQIEYVINLAGYKSVGESVMMPIEYYENNVMGTVTLCEVMKKHGVTKMIFSSSATVYGEPEMVPVTEACPQGEITNPYGWTKAMIEQILTDLANSDPAWSIVILRYFNPIGAHQSGLIGEDPQGTPNNLVPYIAKVAIGQLPEVNVYGDDYPTPDGTGIRDYIHVVDLAKGHVEALKQLDRGSGVRTYNLGTGTGHSVVDVIHAYEKACGRAIPYRIMPRRPGDIAVSFCDTKKANVELGWYAEKSLEEMCEDSWRWQCMNPDGYVEED